MNNINNPLSQHLVFAILCILSLFFFRGCHSGPQIAPHPIESLTELDTICFQISHNKILLAPVSGEKTYRTITIHPELTGAKYVDEDNYLNLNEQTLPQMSAIWIGMSRVDVENAMYHLQQAKDESKTIGDTERRIKEPGIFLRVGDTGGLCRVTGVFSGTPFCMTLSYSGESQKYLQAMTLFFYPCEVINDGEPTEELYTRLKKTLTAQLGNPDAGRSLEDKNAVDESIKSCGWVYNDGALILLQKSTEGANHIYIHLSGVV